MIRGNPKFDSITVAKFDVSFLGPTLTFSAEAAFANSQTGQTHGWTRNTQWSPTTIEKLKELRSLMELDLGAMHLTGGGEVLVGPSSVAAPRSFTPEGGGLGEFLGDERVPSV
jgi:hypothetical protein